MKVLNVVDGDYKITVQNSGTIIFDTGSQTGTTIVTGDLLVQGNTTTVESETMTVRDNIIVVNQGETGAGVTLGTAGIQVDRGSLPDAQILWIENETHYSPTTASTVLGTWVFRRDNGTLTGIQTNSIDTNQGVLALISSGSAGYVTVTGTANYERNILSYTDTVTYNPAFGVSIIDDDRIPNIKAVADYQSALFATYVPEFFGSGDTIGQAYDTQRFTGVASCSGTTLTIISVTTFYVKVGDFIAGSGIPGGVTILSFLTGIGGVGTYQISTSLTFGAQAISAGDPVSKLTFRVDNVVQSEIDSSGLKVNNLRLGTNILSSTTGGITIDPTNGQVAVDGFFQLAVQGSDPGAVASNNMLYHKTATAGDSGLFFRTPSRNDELVSRRRAILFGMIF